MEQLGVRQSKLKVRHSIDTERSAPAKRSVHNAPLDDTLMLVADDLLPELAPLLALGPALALPEELLLTVSCPEISEKKNKERP